MHRTKSQQEINSIESKLKNLNISQKKRDVNILLLGETGVGKSTFINSFFNYITFSSFKNAKHEKLQVVIPSKFTITDENYIERIVRVGEDHNENIEVGASSTQACRSYVYPIPDCGLKIRLIDTPGIGDTRGIQQDNINFDNILSFIGELKHLNAICILLKPNNSRLTVMFEFCIKQLLSRLEKSASQNLLFVFTNTRSTFYRPGETLPALRKLLDTVKVVQIPCEKRNVFCTDNESFRFLAAYKNGVEFSSDDIRNFSQSWKQSYEECQRMILYITGDDQNKGLIPHDVKNTISINEARRLIVRLSQPLAEIAQLIQDNIRAISRHQQRLRQTNTSLSELRAKLYVPIIDLKITKLDQPTTVCTSPKCSTVYQVDDKKKWHFGQRCHDPCYLKSVPEEIIGSPELINCASMNRNGECKKCSCRYQVHMHIYYISETFENRLEDETIKSDIVSKEKLLEQVDNFTIDLSNRLAKLNKERDLIIKTTAKFACFLKTNAITPYNDAYEAYLEYLIDREKSMNTSSDLNLIKELEKMLREYTEEKITILDAKIQPGNSGYITADDIINGIQTIYSLEIFGTKIRELFEAQSRARKDENKSQVKEYIFKNKPKNQNKNDNQQRDHHQSLQFQLPSSRSQNTYHEPRPRYTQQNTHHPNFNLQQDHSGRINLSFFPSSLKPVDSSPNYSRAQYDQRHNMPFSYHTSSPPPYSPIPPIMHTSVPDFYAINHHQSHQNQRYFPASNYASNTRGARRKQYTNPTPPHTRGARRTPMNTTQVHGYLSEPDVRHRQRRNYSGNPRHNLHPEDSSSDSG